MLYLLCDIKLWLWPWLLNFKFWKKKLYHRNKRVDWPGTKRTWVDRMLDPSCDFDPSHDPDLEFSRSNFEEPYFRNGKVHWLRMKEMWIVYNVACIMGLLLGYSAWQIGRPSNGSMWKSNNFQPVGPWMGYSFTDLGAEGCSRSLNALFQYRYHASGCMDTIKNEMVVRPYFLNHGNSCIWFNSIIILRASESSETFFLTTSEWAKIWRQST